MSILRNPVRRHARKIAASLVPITALVSAAVCAQSHVDWNLIDEYCTECHNLDDFAGST